jgi:hypothetical protein
MSFALIWVLKLGLTHDIRRGGLALFEPLVNPMKRLTSIRCAAKYLLADSLSETRAQIKHLEIIAEDLKEANAVARLTWQAELSTFEVNACSNTDSENLRDLIETLHEHHHASLKTVRVSMRSTDSIERASPLSPSCKTFSCSYTRLYCAKRYYTHCAGRRLSFCA